MPGLLIDDSDTPWRNAEVLERLYWGENMTQTEIGDLFDKDQGTIKNWMQEHGIETRNGARLDTGEPWQDEEVLRRLYHGNGMTLEEIGDMFDVGHQRVGRRMKYHDIETRGRGRDSPPALRLDRRGYEIFKSKHKGTTYKFAHHQLIAIADGADPYKVFSSGDYHVHHNIPVRWLNYDSNLSLLPASEHHSEHRRASDEDLLETVEKNPGMGTMDVAESAGYRYEYCYRRLRKLRKEGRLQQKDRKNRHRHSKWFVDSEGENHV